MYIAGLLQEFLRQFSDFVRKYARCVMQNRIRPFQRKIFKNYTDLPVKKVKSGSYTYITYPDPTGAGSTKL
jgi:hypothetical protein